MKRYLILGGLLFSIVGCQSTPLTAEPPAGTLPQGKKVLVDDGSCPAGQIKQITGGNGNSVPRKRECVARPA